MTKAARKVAEASKKYESESQSLQVAFLEVLIIPLTSKTRLLSISSWSDLRRKVAHALRISVTFLAMADGEYSTAAVR